MCIVRPASCDQQAAPWNKHSIPALTSYEKPRTSLPRNQQQFSNVPLPLPQIYSVHQEELELKVTSLHNLDS